MLERGRRLVRTTADSLPQCPVKEVKRALLSGRDFPPTAERDTGPDTVPAFYSGRSYDPDCRWT
jgi:hypothetical protein